MHLTLGNAHQKEILEVWFCGYATDWEQRG